jgi:hypothetical protein
MRVAIANDKDVEHAPWRHAESWKRRLRDSRDAALAKSYSSYGFARVV